MVTSIQQISNIPLRATQQVSAQLLQSGVFANYCKPPGFSAAPKDTFTTAAKSHGKGVQQKESNPTGFAARILGKNSDFYG